MDTTTSLKPNQPGARLRWAEPVSGTIKLAGILHIETAAELHQVLSEMFARCSQLPSDLPELPPCQLDLSDVEVCGTPGVQLLLSAQKTAAAKQIPFHLVSPSPAVTNAFSRFAIDSPFDKNIQPGVSL